ncbi:hypothetical protein CQJ94_08555 [Glycomyces fuscus]|nr:hypothetical protein CQJ94_08555 [Glycomyces fuscus]
MHQFPTPAPVSVLVDIPAGRIRAIAADRADTTVEVRPADPAKGRDTKAAERTRVDCTDGVLRVHTPEPGNRLLGPSGSVEVTVQLPAGSNIEAKSSCAGFRSVGRLGEVVCEGADGTDGAVEIDEAASMRLTAFGDVTVGRLTGPARISTHKGGIHVAEATSGAVELTTQMGDVTVGAAAGVRASLDAGTPHGRVHNALVNTGGSEAALAIHATTGQGDITARSL